MNYKALIAAAAAAAVLPMTASATTVFADGGTTSVGAGDSVSGFFLALGDGGAGTYEHTFQLDDEGDGSARVTIDASLIASFAGLVAEWLESDGTTVVNSAVITDEITTLTTTFEDPGTLTQILRLSWDESIKGTGFDGTITVSTVPVPAGLLLMGTALAGLGMTRRKKA